MSSRIAAKTGGQSASVALETAEMLFRNEKYTDAIVKYNEAIVQTNNDSLKHYMQSRVIVSYFRLDNIKEADKRAGEFVKANFTGAVQLCGRV